MKLVLLLTLCFLCLLASAEYDEYDEVEQDEDEIIEAKERLYSMLFPHQNRSRQLYGEFITHSELNCPNIRQVGSNSTPTVVPCIKCSGLTTCSILNGFTVQEVYYPNNLDLRGTCTIIESLGNQMTSQIFGTGRSFRDTPQCRGESSSICFCGEISFFFKPSQKL